MYYLSSEESGLYDIGFDTIRMVAADNVHVPRHDRVKSEYLSTPIDMEIGVRI